MHLELPSRYIPYNFKSVSLLNVSPAFIAPMSRAVEDDSLAPVLEAVQLCIDVDVKELTEGDFFYVLTALRILAFKRNHLVARWQCNGGMLFERKDTNERLTLGQVDAIVEQYREAEDKTGLIDPDQLQVELVSCEHRNEEPVTMDDLIMYMLPEDDSVNLDPRLDFPRARLISEAYDLSDDPDYGPFVRVAKWVRDGDTLLDKIEMIKNDMDLFELAHQAESNYRHGISRYIVKTCRACGNQNTIAMEVKAASFIL